MENSNSSASVESTSQNESDQSGCGCSNIIISVNPTTGGHFDLAVTKNDTIENLKKLISKKLKVPKERICLLHRERQLRDGTVHENQLVNGSRLTLLPSVETGLLAQRPEQSVMQALESLNDCQVNDFLSGKAPLNLTMRLGDHMMLIQLQLSTVTPNSSSQSSSSTTTASTSSSSSSSLSSPTSGAKRVIISPKKSSPISSNKTSLYAPSLSTSQPQHKDPLASLSSIVESTAPSPTATPLNPTIAPSATSTTTNSNSSINTATVSPTTNNISPDNSMTTSNSNNLTTPVTNSPSSFSTPVTLSPSIPVSSPPSSTSSIPPSTSSSTTTSSSTSSLLEGCKCDSSTAKPTLDTRALAEASRNLTQTLKQLSSEVLTSKSDPVEDVATSTKRRQGAIIESMHHHGKGVYSGTFSGTLNPALQDRFGRPKRDISTIIHILNDLLCATPQYRNCRGASSSTSNNSSASSSGDKSATSAQPTASTISDAEGTSSGYLSTSESLENQATRGKMERLRLIMEERREKRRAARSSPYARNPGGQPVGQLLNSIGGINHTQWSAKSETQRTNTSSTATDQPNLPMDTDLCSQPEVSPEPVVA